MEFNDIIQKQADEISALYNNLYENKSEKRANMDIAGEFFDPNDAILSGQQPLKSVDNTDEERILLDTSPIKVFNDYVAYVLGLSFYTGSKWFRIGHLKVSEGSDEQKILSARAAILHRLIQKSNYAQQIVNLEKDVVGYGHGLFVIDGCEDNFAKCYAKNPYDVVFEADTYGEVFSVMWEQEYTKNTLFRNFPDASIPEDDTSEGVAKTYTVLCAFNGLDYDGITLSEEDRDKHRQGYKYVLRYFLKTHSKSQTDAHYTPILNSQYFKSKAVMPARDVATRNYPYGNGKFRDLVPKARILNAISFGELEMITQDYDPPLYVDSSVYQEGGDKRIRAGTRFIRKSKSTLQATHTSPIEIIRVKGDLASVKAIHDQHKEELADTMPTGANIYKTARQSVEEIYQRMSDEDKKLAPIRACYAKEAVNMHLKRFYEMADRQGYFKDLPMPNKDIDISPNSKDLIFDGFLLQKQKEGEVRRISHFLSLSSLLAPSHPQSLVHINADLTIKSLADNLEVFRLIYGDEVVRQIRERTAAEAERQQQREDQKVAGQGAGELAQVAKTLLQG